MRRLFLILAAAAAALGITAARRGGQALPAPPGLLLSAGLLRAGRQLQPVGLLSLGPVHRGSSPVHRGT